MNDPSLMMTRSFGIWPPFPPPAEDRMGFMNPTLPLPPPFAAPGAAMPGRMNWKVKKVADKRKKAAAGGRREPSGGGGVSGYIPSTLHELQYQNRAKARRFFPKKKFARSAPFAPRNTTSFIIRAKKSGGIAPLVSPCPVTPAVLSTPKFSPTRDDLADMVKEEWGVDGYGSMKGLIRLRSPNRAGSGSGDENEEGSSETDVEEHLEVERRLDQDVSRFEMVFPEEEEQGMKTAADLLESRVEDQDAHIAQLEEENLTLKERLFLIESEMEDFRRRLQLLETRCREREEDNGVDNNKDDSNGGNTTEAAPENEEDGAESSGARMLEGIENSRDRNIDWATLVYID
ncbi:uncharacterized protein LOC103970931 [Musa acuminata AAA Group]|uniref:uncharacterized protein LOC103970931 n=1 Tax=Musa acuminata AAA Group TaxID=214697 RepID=UPI0031D5233A